jgi:hypothetical protein
MSNPNTGGTPWESCVLLDLSFNRWGLTRRVASAEVDVREAGTDNAVPPQALRLTKKLLACEEYDVILSKDGETRRRVTELSLPFRRGLYAVPVKLVDRVVQVLRAREGERRDEVEAFVRAYGRAVEQARVDLGPLFREDDYPSAEDVRREFGVRWTFVELSAAGRLRQVSQSLYASEEAKVREQWQEAAEGMRQAMRQAFAQLVASLRERLDGERENGKAKVFRDSRVESLKDWLGLFDARNVTDDGDLSGLVEQARKLLAGVSPEELRKQADTRAEVASGLKAIEQACSTLVVVDAPRRKFRLADAD